MAGPIEIKTLQGRRANVFCHRFAFGNFFTCSFIMEGKEFNSVQQCYGYMKAMHVGDRPAANRILRAKIPAVQLAYTEQIKNNGDSQWQRVCKSVI